jgi:hypothetical protein
MVGIALVAVLARPRLDVVCLISLLVLIFSLSSKIHSEERETRRKLSTLTVSPEVSAYLRQNRNARIYIQNLDLFCTASYHEPDPEIRSRLVLLFSRETELRLRGVDTVALIAMHMKRFTSLDIEHFESLTAQPGPHLIVFPGWVRREDWVKEAIENSHARVDPVWPAFGGVAALVQFQP